MTTLPSGTVTFLFTDIEGSTDIARSHPADWEALRARHDALLQDVVQAHRGHVFKRIGDAFCVAFHTADEALHAALAAQRRLQAESWSPAPVRVRMGLHTGDAQPSVDAGGAHDYVGYRTLARAQQVMSVANGCQVLLSNHCCELVRDALPAEAALEDLGQHRLKGFADPEKLWQATAPGLRREFPVLRSRASTPNNLPPDATRFIGRAQEVAECRRLMEQSRLLTLTAIGGAGKTRLAIEVARGALDDYPDGVWFVDLAQVQEGDRVTQSAADALGLREQPGLPLRDTLIRHLAARRTLLVLDNCEHVLDAAATLAEALLERCSRIAILATSREGLGVRGEQIFALRSLRTPTGSDLDSVRDSEAVALFMDRARLADPSLQLDETSAPVVADICRRLDGIALAIELAAARAKMLKLADIRARLGDRFRLLTGGNRALPRQQTLLATLHWSYDQLTPAEQSLLRRLGIFVGGWTLPAATAVASDGADEFEVLDTLTRLADKSLIALDRDAQGESRYTMVETVRQYACDRLEDAQELQDAQVRHVKFFVALATDSLPSLLESGALGAWLARIDPEHENLLAAHGTCGLHADLVGPGLELVGAMAHYWDMRAMFGLGHRMIAEALARQGAEAPSQARCVALERLAHIALFLGRYDEAVRSVLEALAIARSLHDNETIARVLETAGGIFNATGDLREARRCLEEGLQIAQGLGGRRLYRTRHMMAELLRREGDLAGAEQTYVENLAASRAIGRVDSVRSGLINLGLVAAQRENVPELRRYLAELMAATPATVDQRRDVVALELCAALASIVAAWEVAARFHGAAQAFASRMDLHLEPVDTMVIDPLVERARAALGDAAFAAAHAGGHGLTLQEARAEANAWLAFLT